MITHERRPTTGELRSRLDGSLDAVASLERHLDEIAAWASLLAATFGAGGRLLAAGNGGSAAQSGHLVAEIVGRFEGERAALPAVSLVTDPAVVTALGNDYGFEHMIERQVAAHARPGDVVVLLSTSGRSPNLVAAAAQATASGAHPWGLIGPGDSPLSLACERSIRVDARATSHIQEAHQVLIHLLCAALDVELSGIDRLDEGGGIVP